MPNDQASARSKECYRDVNLDAKAIVFVELDYQRQPSYSLFGPPLNGDAETAQEATEKELPPPPPFD